MSESGFYLYLVLIGITLNISLPLLTSCVSSFPEELFLYFELSLALFQCFLSIHMSSLYKNDFKASSIPIVPNLSFWTFFLPVDSDRALTPASLTSPTAAPQPPSLAATPLLT